MKIETKRLLKIAFILFGLYLCVYYWEFLSGLLSTIFSAGVPLAAGCVIAYLVNILMGFYERHYFPASGKKIVLVTRRPLCMIGAMVTMVAIVSLIVWLILPELISCIQLILSILPPAIEKGLAFLESRHILSEDIVDWLSSIDWKSRIGEIAKILTSGVGSVMGTVIKTVSSLFSILVTALISIIFSVYLLVSKDRLRGQAKRVMRRYLPQKVYEKAMYVLVLMNDCFHRYIVGQCTEAVILGILCTVGMMIFRFPYATMIGALIAFTALIPIAGAYIGAGVGAFMILTVSPFKALMFLIFIIVLQQLEGNIVYPRVVGSSIGLPGIWVLAAVTIGGGVFGIPGMLLGVPLTAALYRLLRDDLNKPKTPAAE